MWLNLHDDGTLTSDTDSVPAECELFGLTDDGRYALVKSPHAGPEAYVFTVNGRKLSGARWECTNAHLAAYEDVYRKRFPRTEDA